MGIVDHLKQEREILSALQENYKKELYVYPDYRLFERKRRGKTTYYYKEGSNPKEHVINWSNNKELLAALLSRETARKEIVKVEENIFLIEKLIVGLENSLEVGGRNSLLRVEGNGMPVVVSKNTYRSNELRHDTGLGFKTRSKSEALIAQILHKYGARFVYEEQLMVQTLDGRTVIFHPDFTIYTASGRKIYLEHAGKFHEAGYAEDFYEKLRIYHHNNVILGQQLFVTMDSKDGDINLAEIELLIRWIASL